ncbi:MAG TPA: two-component regulator propeller domain-containing protein [Flavilitoribacter sp.]|nr:two-component regulator propeller domain-containing protein [Flavilitoribacter sp.]
MYKSFFLLGCLLACCSVSRTQPGQSSFVHYTTDQGLTIDYITDIVKDKQGFLWVGTVNGLNRFDGINFRQFFHDPGKPDGLPDNFIRGISLAPNGSLWSSSDKGVCRIDPVTLKFTRLIFPENLDSLDNNDRCGKVVFGPDGRGWVSLNRAVYAFDPGTYAIEAFPVPAVDAGLPHTFMDRTGKMWMINQAKVSWFDTKTKRFRAFNIDVPGNPLAGAGFQSIQEDLSGKLWLASWFKGLATYDPALDSLIDYPDGNWLTTVISPDITPEGDTVFWMGGGGYGFFKMDMKTGEYTEFPPNSKDIYSHNNYLVRTLFKDDSDGSLWLGTEAGLEHYAPAALRFERVILPIDRDFGQFSLMSGAIQDINDPSGNTVYIAMWGSGLFKWDRRKNTFEHYYEANSGLRNNGILCSTQDRKGILWLGTAGVSSFNPKTGAWGFYDIHAETINEDCNVLSILESPDGNIWFGANRGGLFRYNPATNHIDQIRLPEEAYLENGRMSIFGMDADRQGRIWLATNQYPVRYDPRTGRADIFRVEYENHAYDNWRDVKIAPNGILYANSQNCILEMDSTCRVLRRFGAGNGLKTNELFFLTIDQLGQVWCNSTYQLHCLDPKTGIITHYGTADGLFKNTITDGLNILPGGEIFIGFQNAFNYFNPARLQRNTTPPPVAITSMKVMDKERNPEILEKSWWSKLVSSRRSGSSEDTLLIVRPGEDIFTIEFAALNFNQPERNQYAYKLEGFNDDWVATRLNLATYTNLDGGDYRFRVKAANNDGVWNETGAHILVRVIPPMPRRWYFKVLILMTIALIFAGIWYYRRQQRLHLELFRENLARDLHDEMGSTLSSIRFFSEFAGRQVGGDRPEVSSILQRISHSASVLSESMQDIIWAMKRKNDQLEDLAARMTEFGLRMMEARDVAFRTRVADGFSGKYLKPEVRRNLYLIFKEAINNVAKYARATEVELSLSLSKGWIRMTIADNGQGFDLENANLNTAGGNGIPNMHKRAEEIGGKLEIISRPGKGTKVSVAVRI